MEPAPIPPPPPPPPPNRPPLALGTLPSAALVVGDTLGFSVSDLFRDPDGDPLTYAADVTPAGVATGTATADRVTVTGVRSGTVTLTVTARDPGGLSAALSSSLTVRPPNGAPAIVDTMPARTLTVGVSLTVDLSAYFTDPDGDSLAYVAESSDADVATASATDATLNLAAVSPGAVTVTVTAQDTEGLTVAQGFRVTVIPPNRPPAVAETIVVEALRVGESATVDVSGAFRDPDGDALVHAAASRDTGVVTASVVGVTLTLTAREVGAATVAVTARDPEGLSAEQQIRVTVETPNRPPEAVEMLGQRRIRAGSADTLDVSPYFQDPDGDPLAYVAETTNPDVAIASASGAVVTVTGVAAGTATVTVTARDTEGLTVAQGFQVTVNPPNRPPAVADAIVVETLRVGESAAVDVSGAFRDPDGDTLMYAAASADTGIVRASVVGVTLTVTARHVGAATVTVTARDPGGPVGRAGHPRDRPGPQPPARSGPHAGAAAPPRRRSRDAGRVAVLPRPGRGPAHIRRVDNELRRGRCVGVRLRRHDPGHGPRDGDAHDHGAGSGWALGGAERVRRDRAAQPLAPDRRRDPRPNSPRG